MRGYPAQVARLEKLHKAFGCDLTIEKAEAQADGSGGPTRFVAIASTGQQDRDGEYLDPAGMEFTPGAPLLYGHDYSDINANIGVVESAESDGDRVIARGVFDDDIPVHRAAIIAAGKAKKGRLQKLSVGFIPKQVTRPDGQVITLGNGEWMWPEPGNRYTAWRMVELSFVPVPSNDGASLISARSLDGPGGKALRDLIRKALTEILTDSEFLGRLAEAQKAAPGGKGPDDAPATAPAVTAGDSGAHPFDDDLDRLLAGEEPLAVANGSQDPAALARELAAAADDFDLDALLQTADSASATAGA